MAPLLPLDTFRSILGWNPWHFWGFSDGDLLAVSSACNSLITQHAWQNTDAVGRAEILEAIEHAEDRLREHLRYSVAPRYSEDTVSWPQYHDLRLWFRGNRAIDDHWQTVQLKEGYIQAAGIEELTLIGTVTVAGGSLVYSDQDGDGIQETFVATIATTVTDTNQIALYFAAADRLDGESASARWRIQPVTVMITGGTATIRGRRWLLARPVLYEGLLSINSGQGLNPATAGNLVTSLEVYRRRTNGDGNTTTTSQATLTWETLPCPACGWCCTTSDSSADPAAIATAVGRVGIRDAMHGVVMPAEAVYDSATGIWSTVCWDAALCRPPDKVTVRYLAGVPLVDGQMEKRWQVAVTRLALAELARPICACDTANREVYRWQFDLARSAGANDEAYGAVSAQDLDNPLGTRRGHVYAWKEIKNLRLARGFLPG